MFDTEKPTNISMSQNLTRWIITKIIVVYGGSETNASFQLQSVPAPYRCAFLENYEEKNGNR